MKRKPHVPEGPVRRRRRRAEHEHDEKKGIHRVLKMLESIRRKLNAIHAQGAQIIMANAETKAILVKIDDETTAVGQKVADLLAQVNTGMSPAEVAEVNAAGEAIVARLTAIAANPDNPVPETPPDA